MDGFRLFDTYKRYKTGQNKFTTWLKQTAEKCGYNSNSPREERKPKNPRGKLTQNAPSGTVIRMAEFAGLAKAIVAQMDSIPGSIIQTLRDVIVQRKKAFKHYQKGLGYDVSGSDGHLHIIEVLEDVMKIFEGARSKENAGDKTFINGHGMSTAEAQMNNLFELLEIENPLPEDESSAQDETEVHEQEPVGRKRGKSTKKNAKSKKSSKTKATKDFIPSNMKYEMEESDDDVYFLIYCFFEDFNNTRDYLQERWCDYQDGIISLSTVAVITNTAFDMFQRGEKEMLSQIPKYSGLDNFKGISDLLFTEQGLQHVDYDSTTNLEGEDLADAIFEEADWIGLPTYWTLAEFLKHTPSPTAVPIVPPAEVLKGPGPHRSDKKIAWGKEVIMELIAEATILRGLKRREGMRIPAEDELTRGLIEMLMDYKIPIWLVFACQVYLDIRFILESDLDRPHKELVAKGEQMKLTLGQYIDFQKPITGQTPKLLKLALDEVECWITNDSFARPRVNVRTAVGVSGEGLEPYFYLRRNPLLCGLMVFRSDLTMNEHGLAMANIWGVTFGMAHLYNALRHELPEFPIWKDMEFISAIHGLEVMFTGACPQNASEYLKCWEMAAGAKPSEFARTNGQSQDLTTVPSRHGPRGLLASSRVSEIFHERYCFSHDRPVITLENVEAFVNESVQDRKQLTEVRRLVGSSASMPAEALSVQRSREQADAKLIMSGRCLVKRQFEKTRALTPIQVLDILSSSTEHESVALTFNYFSLHERCTRLLRSIHKEFESEINALAEHPLDEAKFQLPFVIRYLFVVMIKDERGMEWSGKKAGKVTKRVGEIVQKVVEEEGEAEIWAVRTGLAGPTANYRANGT